MKISRRNLLALGSVGLAGSKLTGENIETIKNTPPSSNVKILDIQVASIQDDYICHLVKDTHVIIPLWSETNHRHSFEPGSTAVKGQ